MQTKCARCTAYAIAVIGLLLPEPVHSQRFESCEAAGQRLQDSASQILVIQSNVRGCNTRPDEGNSQQGRQRLEVWERSPDGRACAAAFQTCRRIRAAEGLDACERFLQFGRGTSEQLSIAEQIADALRALKSQCTMQ